MNITDTIAFFALLTLFLALFFSCFISFKDKKRNNQDQLFQEKLASYKELLYLAYTAHEKYFDLVDYVQSFNGDEAQWEKKYLKISGSYFGLAFEFKYALLKSSFIIPKEILEEINELEFTLTHFVTSVHHRSVEITSKAYNVLAERIENIENLIRKDLNIDNLNIGLNKRIE